jgi:hypothetical protein
MTNAKPVQTTPSVSIEAIASIPGASAGTCVSPSGSSTSAATSCVPATVATGSTPVRFRLRYQAATA